MSPQPSGEPDHPEVGTSGPALNSGSTFRRGLHTHVEVYVGLTAGGGRLRERVLASMTAVAEYEQELFAVLLAGLETMPHVRLYGRAGSRTATAYFTVEGWTPVQVAAHLAEARVNVWDGDNYAWELAGALGLRDSGGAVRAGLVHYNDRTDVDRLLAAVAELAG